MEARGSDCFLAISVHSVRFDESSEHSVRPGTFHVHIRACDVSIFMSLLDQVKNFFFARHVPFNAVLQERLSLVFTNLKLLLSEVVKEIENRFVVDLYIRALDFEFDFCNVGVLENELVVQ